MCATTSRDYRRSDGIVVAFTTTDAATLLTPGSLTAFTGTVASAVGLCARWYCAAANLAVKSNANILSRSLCAS